MSCCFGCYFHDTGCMYNGCHYFESEYYREPDTCDAFSTDGNLSPEVENMIFVKTNGAFGESKEEQE